MPVKKKKHRGRDPGFTEDQIKSLENILTAHPSIKTACNLSGIRTGTYYDWIDKAKSNHPNSIYSKFADRMERAIQLGKLSKIKTIQDHSKQDWRAAAWLLERTHPDEFAQQDRLAVQHTGSIEHKAIIVNLPPLFAAPKLPPRRIEATSEPIEDAKDEC